MRTFPSRWQEAARNRRRSSRTTSHLRSLSAIVGCHATATPEEEINLNDATPKSPSLNIPCSPRMALYATRSVQSWALDASFQSAGEFSTQDEALLGGARLNFKSTKSFLHFSNTAEKEQSMLQDLSDTEIESGADPEGSHADFKDISGEISDGEEEASFFFCRKTINARRMRGDFPPPLASLSSRKAQEGCVQLRSFRSKGRFMLREVNVAPRLPFLSMRSNGRLVLQLIHPRALANRCCSDDTHTSSASIASEAVDNILLDKVEPAAVECSMKEAEQNCASDKFRLNQEETGKIKGPCKIFPLNEALEYSEEAVEKIPGSKAFLLDQQTHPRCKYSDQEADWVVAPTDSPRAHEGSIATEQIISGDAAYLLNQKASRDTKLPGANLIIYRSDKKAEDPGKRAETIFMVHTTRPTILSSGSSRKVAGNELKAFDSISSLTISKTNECAYMASDFISRNKGILAQ